MTKITVGMLSLLQVVTNQPGKEKLSDLFERLLGERYPVNWEIEIPSRHLELEDPKVFNLLQTTKAEIMGRTYIRGSLDTWTIKRSDVSMEDATRMFSANPRNIIVVSKKAAALMKDRLTCNTFFVDGSVYLDSKQIKAYD